MDPTANNYFAKITISSLRYAYVSKNPDIDLATPGNNWRSGIIGDYFRMGKDLDVCATKSPIITVNNTK